MTSAPDLLARLLPLYPALSQLPALLLQEVLAQHVMPIQAPAGTVLFDEGSPCQGFPMVLSGDIKVARGSPQGRSLELYRVTPGEVCVASTSCLFGHQSFSVHGITASATELLLIDKVGFERWVTEPAFRAFVFGVFGDRLADLMALAEAVAFQRLDQRLATCLLGRGSPITTTHQALADELGTVREMVTRLLKRFEQAGWLQLGRERITVLDAKALRELAQGAM